MLLLPTPICPSNGGYRGSKEACKYSVPFPGQNVDRICHRGKRDSVTGHHLGRVVPQQPWSFRSTTIFLLAFERFRSAVDLVGGLVTGFGRSVFWFWLLGLELPGRALTSAPGFGVPADVLGFGGFDLVPVLQVLYLPSF